MMYAFFVFLLIGSAARLANHYQAKWQDRKDEADLIRDSVDFCHRWGRVDAQVDERYRDTITETDILVERQRIIDAQRDESAEAVPDATYINAAVNRIHYDAGNSWRALPDNPPPHTRLQRDKRMFARIEQEKAARGILPLNEDGIFYEGVSPRRG